MTLTMRRIAAAAGLAMFAMAGHAATATTTTPAKSVTYEFKTFFNTATATKGDTKSQTESVASLTFTDIAGGVKVSLTQNVNSFPQKSGGTLLDNLWFTAPAGKITAVSGTAPSSLLTSFSTTKPSVPEAGYSFPWSVSFGSLIGTSGIKEGGSSVFNLIGTGVNVNAILAKSTVMIDLTNVGSPYNTSFLGLGAGNVRFLGNIKAIPEPSTYALMGLGLVGVAFAARRRQA